MPFLIGFAVVLVILIACIKIVPQARASVVERLGAYHATWKTGMHILIPFIDRVAKSMSLKEQVADFPPQPVITKDNVHMLIDTVVYYQIADPKLYTYGVELPMSAIENLTTTTLRNIIGELELDKVRTARKQYEDNRNKIRLHCFDCKKVKKANYPNYFIACRTCRYHTEKQFVKDIPAHFE